MGNLRAALSVALLSVAACGDGGSAKPDAPLIHLDAAIDAVPDSPPPPDAPNYDFTCLNNTAPTTASATITVTGTASTIAGMAMAPADNVTLEARTVAGDNLLDSDGPTTTSGNWTLGPITGNTPVDAYIKATRSGTGGERTTLVYTPQPLVADQANVPVLLISDTQLNGLLMGLLTQEANKGFFGVAILDCAGMPIDGAAISVKQNNVEVGSPFDIGQFASQFAGTFFVFNVPVNDNTVVNATYNGMTFRAHSVKSAANTTTTTIVRPGF